MALFRTLLVFSCLKNFCWFEISDLLRINKSNFGFNSNGFLWEHFQQDIDGTFEYFFGWLQNDTYTTYVVHPDFPMDFCENIFNKTSMALLNIFLVDFKKTHILCSPPGFFCNIPWEIWRLNFCNCGWFCQILSRKFDLLNECRKSP